MLSKLKGKFSWVKNNKLIMKIYYFLKKYFERYILKYILKYFYPPYLFFKNLFFGILYWVKICLGLLPLETVDAEQVEEKKKEELETTNSHVNIATRENRAYIFQTTVKNKHTNSDLLYFHVFSKKYDLDNYKLLRLRSNIRSARSDYNYHVKPGIFDKKDLNAQIKNNFYSGILYFIRGFRFWILPIILSLLVVFYISALKSLPFNKVVGGWVCIGMLGYWLFSGFVFFIKKYQYGKYTSAIQRFWRRSYIVFWSLEFFTFGVFFFLTLNANQEIWHMFDQIRVFKTHFLSWRLFLIKIMPTLSIIILTYILINLVKYTNFSKQIHVVAVISTLLVYIVWIEFYQFFHVLNFYGNLNWVYESEERAWNLEPEVIRTTQANNYAMLLIFLKFWHIIFIFAMWVFFLLRVNELGRVRYPMLSANFQNFIILYIFSWLFMYPWFKFFLRRFINEPYFWFMLNPRKLGFRIFFYDMKLVFLGLLEFFQGIFKFNFWVDLKKSAFYHWSLVTALTNFEGLPKHVVKQRVIESNKWLI